MNREELLRFLDSQIALRAGEVLPLTLVKTENHETYPPKRRMKALRAVGVGKRNRQKAKAMEADGFLWGRDGR